MLSVTKKRMAQPQLEKTLTSTFGGDHTISGLSGVGGEGGATITSRQGLLFDAQQLRSLQVISDERVACRLAQGLRTIGASTLNSNNSPYAAKTSGQKLSSTIRLGKEPSGASFESTLGFLSVGGLIPPVEDEIPAGYAEDLSVDLSAVSERLENLDNALQLEAGKSPLETIRCTSGMTSSRQQDASKNTPVRLCSDAALIVAGAHQETLRGKINLSAADPQAPTSVAASPGVPPPQRKLLVEVTVEIEAGKQDIIQIHDGDSCAVLAANFVVRHGLPAERILSTLHKYLESMLARHLAGKLSAPPKAKPVHFSRHSSVDSHPSARSASPASISVATPRPTKSAAKAVASTPVGPQSRSVNKKAGVGAPHPASVKKASKTSSRPSSPTLSRRGSFGSPVHHVDPAFSGLPNASPISKLGPKLSNHSKHAVAARYLAPAAPVPPAAPQETYSHKPVIAARSRELAGSHSGNQASVFSRLSSASQRPEKKKPPRERSSSAEAPKRSITDHAVPGLVWRQSTPERSYGSAGERLYELGALQKHKEEQRVKQTRAALEAEEARAATFRPSINRSSSRQRGGASSTATAQNEHTGTMTSEDLEMKKHCTFQPKIVARNRTPSRRSEAMSKPSPCGPQPSQRAGGAVDRLYTSHKQTEMKLEEMRKHRETYDPATGLPLFRPNVRGTSKRI